MYVDQCHALIFDRYISNINACVTSFLFFHYKNLITLDHIVRLDSTKCHHNF